MPSDTKAPLFPVSVDRTLQPSGPLPVSPREDMPSSPTVPALPVSAGAAGTPIRLSSAHEKGNAGQVVQEGAHLQRRRHWINFMSLPVVLLFSMCFVYMFLALSGVGYVDPSSLAAAAAAAPRPDARTTTTGATAAFQPVVQVPPGWSREPSQHQREMAYAQAIGLSKGLSREEIEALWKVGRG